jgi:hypothetical protein
MILHSAARSTRSPAPSRLPSLTGASFSSPAMAEAPPMHNTSPERCFRGSIETALLSQR